jgi:hypothetical protein
MDHEQNQGTPLTSLMHWDQNGELCSEDLERLLAQLLAQELSQQKQDQSSANRRRDFVSPRARHPVKQRDLAQEHQLATRPRTT